MYECFFFLYDVAVVLPFISKKRNGKNGLRGGDGNKIRVPTSYPLRDMFENREASGRIGKWAA
jgi:hypothetical protein